MTVIVKLEKIFMVIWALLLCHTLNLKKSRVLWLEEPTDWAEEAENPLSSEDELASNEEPLEDDFCDTNIEQTNYSAVEDDSSNECDATTMELTNLSTDFVGMKAIQLAAYYRLVSSKKAVCMGTRLTTGIRKPFPTQ